MTPVNVRLPVPVDSHLLCCVKHDATNDNLARNRYSTQVFQAGFRGFGHFGPENYSKEAKTPVLRVNLRGGAGGPSRFGKFVLDTIQAIVRLARLRHIQGMQYKIRTEPDEWACTKFCRINLDDDSISDFILWLCGNSREQISARLFARSKDDIIWYDPVEDTWGFDAPRQRMAKLLWRTLHGNTTEEDFHRRFSFPTPLKTSDVGHMVAPLQQRLKWVMDGLFSRSIEDSSLGQGDWGERWWLPAEQSNFVREQLQQTHAELIEQSSDYEDAASLSLSFYVRHTVQAIAVPSRDPARIYVGERRGPHGRVFVWVQDTNGHKCALKHSDEPYREADGTGFEWGYGGHGPSALTRCLLADALDGDLVLADELDQLDDGFFERFILNYPQDDDLRISRAAVLEWLETTGKAGLYEERRQSVSDRLTAHTKAIAEQVDLLARIEETGGLRSQRFDIVPETFESALYLDLMHMLERGGVALRCSGCGLPIPYDHSGRANKQRARSKKGEPIYHPDCFTEYSRKRKTAYWQRRAKSAQFREEQRVRARDYRKLK